MNILRKILFSVAAALTAMQPAAQTSLAVTMHTENYDLYQEENMFTLNLGSTVVGEIGVDCGYGIVKYDIAPATYDAESGDMNVTVVPCVVDSHGDVRIYTYGDVRIDYFNGSGCGLTSIAFHDPAAIDVLSLRHNSLQSLDLSDLTNVSSIDVGGNPYSSSPLVIGPGKPRLVILNIDIVESMDQSFNLSDYPALESFDAFANHSLFRVDPTGCPGLVKISIDATPVSSIDVSKNTELMILNVSETGIGSLDVSNNKKLEQLYCSYIPAGRAPQDRLSSLDISNCRQLLYLFASDNNISSIDVSNNHFLQDLYLNRNLLTEINLDRNLDLVNVALEGNCLDFATLPADRGWRSYTYSQRPMPVARSVKVGEGIDMAGKVLRPQSRTTATAYMINRDDPTSPYPLAPSDYTFADGIVTINAVQPDSVYVTFSNSALPAYDLRTTNFMVKSEEDYGEPVKAVSFDPSERGRSIYIKVGIEGASTASPRTFWVDRGDGVRVEAAATMSGLPAEATVGVECRGDGPVVVYVGSDDQLTALGVNDVGMESIDLREAIGLRSLEITGAGLHEIDLSLNNHLESLTLKGNKLGDYTLAGANGGLNKNSLSYIVLEDNNLESIYLSPLPAIRHLDLSGNLLEEINLTDGENITYLDMSHNRLGRLRLSYQSSLVTLDASFNELTEIIPPETNVLATADISNNRFTFADMPDLGSASVSYAPQAEIHIAPKGNGCNLSDLYVDIDGKTTRFRWFDSEGRLLTEDRDYTINRGVTHFLAPSEGLTLHCEATHEKWPALTLHTSPMLSAGMPQNVVGEFTTPVGGQSATLSLAALADNEVVYIDWGGNGEPTEYQLKATYTLFSAKTVEGAKVKIYSYEPESPLTVFSVNGITMADVDLSGLTNLTMLSLSNAGLSDFVMPCGESLLELSLTGNNFSSFPFERYPGLVGISFEGNRFESVDLSPLADLQQVNFSKNKLKEITFGEHPSLWGLYLSGNILEEIDLSGLPALYQVILDGNRLKHIDLDNFEDLHVVYLDNNALTFETLPVPRSQWTVYYYANQAPLDVDPSGGEVDLSSQLWVGDVESSYIWLEGEPWYDEDQGAMVGYVLDEGVDYEISDGVTRFLRDIDGVMAIVTNEVFPSAYMSTGLMDVKAYSGIDTVLAPRGFGIAVDGRDVEVVGAEGKVALYSVEGILVGSTDSGRFHGVAPGVYIVTDGNYSRKLIVP